ncbi:unnamed protein product, partial [Sphacelaria rigidula]
SFSEAWSGLDSGVGAREEPSLNQAWGDAAKGEEFSSADEAALKEKMEAAWTEATQDPDLRAAWDEQSAFLDEDGEPETLQGIWGKTADQLETGDYLEGARREAPYELNPENRFSELEDPFAEGVRLFEDGQIADAALCFEAEIARNPENSQ